RPLSAADRNSRFIPAGRPSGRHDEAQGLIGETTMAIDGIKVGGQSTKTLEDVAKFFEHAGDQKILGKYDKKTGETTLYIGKKQSSLIDKLTGAASRRKDEAKGAFDQLVAQSFKNIKSSRDLTADDLKNVDSLADNVGKQTGRLGSHAMRA